MRTGALRATHDHDLVLDGIHRKSADARNQGGVLLPGCKCREREH